MRNDDVLVKRAREMRRVPTGAERTFWRLLRSKRLEGFKFRRQEPIGNYIVDFCCHGAKVIVEFDGSDHESRQEYDLARKTWLESQGYTVLRFGSEIVRWSDDETLGVVLRACRREPLD